ncbi:MAG: hypothetical protein R8M45_03005 [Ghiorsea sp.]
MNLAADNLAFLADFGVDATIDNQAARIIYDSAYMASLDVESSNPTALVEATVVVRHGSLLLMNGSRFNVVGVHPDGAGFIMLELEQG